MAKTKEKSKNKSRKGLFIGIGIAAVLLLIVLSVIGTYNTLVKLDVTVDNAWAQVETAYQRRVDLIPNLVSTVKGASDFEQETFTQITEARSQWGAAKTTEDKVAAANNVESSLGRLIAVFENYPQLQATQAYRDLMVQLEGTENRISTERKRYNDEVGVLNKKIRMFPSNIIAGMFGFEKRTFFEAQEGAENAPVVEF